MKIVLTGEIDDARMAEIRAIAPDAEVRFVEGPVPAAEDVADADIVAGHLRPPVLGAAENLKWVHSWAAGPDAQLFPEMVAHPAILTSSKGNGAIPLAEHAMMLMLMLNRNAMRWIEGHRNRKWDPFFHGELNGKTVAILGAGYSGADLALKCKAFHMRTLGLRRRAEPVPNFDRMYDRSQLHEFLGEADFVVVTAPHTPDTAGMLGEREFRAMRPTAFYICFSRGRIAQDDVLYRAVDEEWIAGAGLDAHGVEPLPEDSPFWTLKNTIVTPHNGATTYATKDRGYYIFRDNLKRWMAGEPLVNVVDKQHGY